MSFGKAAVGLLRLLSFLCSIKIINFFLEIFAKLVW